LGHRDQILALLTAFSERDQAQLETSDVLVGNGIAGDAADEFLLAFAGRFDVDLTKFRYYFHYDGDELPGYPKAVARDAKGKPHSFIPITLDMLIAAVERGRWEFDYPAFTLRTTRFPAWVNSVLKLILVAWVVFWVVRLLWF